MVKQLITLCLGASVIINTQAAEAQQLTVPKAKMLSVIALKNDHKKMVMRKALEQVAKEFC